jgi:hypothetical protein
MAVSLTHETEGTTRRLECRELSHVRLAWVEEPIRLERLTTGGGLEGCLACGHPELYTQRDFPRAIGFAVVVVAAVLAPFTHYLSLLAAAALDAILYRFARSVLVCYSCRARHRGFASEPRHPRHDLGIAERLRYGPKAVMGTPMRRGGTAGAPEPEH